MLSAIVEILLAGGACTSKEGHGGAQGTSGHRNKQWHIKLSPISLKLMVGADHAWVVAEEGFLCLLCLQPALAVVLGVIRLARKGAMLACFCF